MGLLTTYRLSRQNCTGLQFRIYITGVRSATEPRRFRLALGLSRHADFQQLSRKIYENGGIVSSVCHGAVGLLNITLSDGTLLIKAKQVTGFSDEEERLAQLDQYVPFMTETELKK